MIKDDNSLEQLQKLKEENASYVEVIKGLESNIRIKNTTVEEQAKQIQSLKAQIGENSLQLKLDQTKFELDQCKQEARYLREQLESQR